MSTPYIDGVALATEARPLLAPLARRDADLAKRLRRVCDEVPEHLEEAMYLTGRRRRAEYAQAEQAAREALACLRAAESVGYLPAGGAELKAKITALLARLAGSSAAPPARG
jgi:hypothetical protein